eukprot:8018027-Heterocapsa_arctica.AAC.1
MGTTYDPVDRCFTWMAAVLGRCGKRVPQGPDVQPGRDPDRSTSEGRLLRPSTRRHPHLEGDQGAGALRPL